MELRQLKYFAQVASDLSFSEASRKLYISQSTLSQQIKQLEDELDTKLLSRNTHNVSLTESGEMLLPLAKRTLQCAKDCALQMDDMKKMPTGELNIGVTYSFCPILTSTIRLFLERYPHVRLNVHYKTMSELREMLRQQEIDFVLAFKPTTPYEDIETNVLFEYSLCVIMRNDHPLASHRTIRVSDLEHYGLAMPDKGLQSRNALERYIDVDTSRLDVRIVLNDPNIILDLVETGDLLTILSSQTVHYRNNLVAKPLEGVNRRMPGCVQKLKGTFCKRSAELFLDMLRKSTEMQELTQ